MNGRQPRSPLFPYTTLFRSDRSGARDHLLSLAAWTRRRRNEQRGRRLTFSSTRPRTRRCCAWHHAIRSEEHTSELQSQFHLVCRLLLEKKNRTNICSTEVV